jgi:hypothetical protein
VDYLELWTISMKIVSGPNLCWEGYLGVNFCFVPVRVPEARLDKKLIWLINFVYWQLYLCISSWFTLLTKELSKNTLLTQVLLVALLRMI